MKKITNSILLFILFALILILLAAYIIEYGLGYKPCNLCIYQRIPYFISIILLINILYLKKYIKISLMTLFLVSISSTVLAFYHVGIEQGFFSEFLCEAPSSQSENIKELLKELKNSPISCKDVYFKIFGLSLATINTIFSFCISAIFIKLFINYGKN